MVVLGIGKLESVVGVLVSSPLDVMGVVGVVAVAGVSGRVWASPWLCSRGPGVIAGALIFMQLASHPCFPSHD